MLSWFKDKFTSRPNLEDSTTTGTASLVKENHEEQHNELTKQQVKIVGETEETLEKAIKQFRECLGAFEEKRNFLVRQQDLYLNQLRKLDEEDGIIHADDLSSSDDEAELAKIDEDLSKFFIDRGEEVPNEDTESVTIKLDEEKVRLSEDSKNAIEMKEVELDSDDEVKVAPSIEPSVLVLRAPMDENDNSDNNNNNNNNSKAQQSSKTPEEREEERKARVQLRNTLKKEIEPIMNEIEKKIMYYRVQIQILQEKKDFITKTRETAQTVLKGQEEAAAQQRDVRV